MSFLKFVLPLILLAFSNISLAQEKKKINIQVLNQDAEIVPFASVTALLKKDTTQKLNTTGDSLGKAHLILIEEQTYIIRISSVNYAPFSQEIDINSLINEYSFFIDKKDKQDLANVVVRSNRPLMRQEDDMTIVDPENLITSSTNGYEVIEKTPGLFIDQDGNIYISSMTPASVQINGRDMKMSAADMATLLKTLPPNAITRIEVVRTPSAKYDASSSGGIVNVVLRKGIKLGMTGSITAGMQQGTYGNQFVNFNLNNNTDKTGSSLTLSYNRRNGFERLETDRTVSVDTVIAQQAYTRYPAESWFGSYAYQMQLGKNWNTDMGGSTNYNKSNTNSSNTNAIEKISSSQLLTKNINDVLNDSYNYDLRLYTNAKKKIDSLGSEWTTDLFYNYTKGNNEQNYSNSFEPSGFITSGTGENSTQRNYWQAFTDLKLKLKNRFTLETGARTTFLNFKSNAAYLKTFSGITNPDDARTNRFNYKENINSAYVQGAKTFGKDIVLKWGLRFENTRMEGLQHIPSDTSFAINRTDLFPYIYLSKGLAKIAGYEMRAYLVYRRTIVRPSYAQLNPFQRYVDEFISEGGNPGLKPQFNDNYEANISIDERPIFAIGLNKTKDIFTNVFYPSVNDPQKATRTFDNIGTNRELYFRAIAAVPPGGKYFIVGGTQYNHNFYEGLYNYQPTTFKKGTWSFFTYQSLKLDHRSTASLMGFMRLKGQQQFYEVSEFGSLTMSVNRKFFNDKLVATLSVNDIFYTNNNRFSLDQGGVKASGFRESDSRRIGLNLRYSFGVRKKEEKNNMMDLAPNME